MKLVIQRVKKASVKTVKDQKVVGQIGKGLFILVGFKKGDSKDGVNKIVAKLAKLRIMSDKNDKMNLSVIEARGSILVVSQFTLYANAEGGNRPSFLEAEEPRKAKELYEFFIKELRNKDIKVETGSFGEYMEIDATLDGPVTIIL